VKNRVVEITNGEDEEKEKKKLRRRWDSCNCSYFTHRSELQALAAVAGAADLLATICSYRSLIFNPMMV